MTEPMSDKRTLLSTLWIVVMLNLITADVLTLYSPGATDAMAEFVGGTPIRVVMFGASILIEVGILMVFLSRILKRSVGRPVNISAAILTIIFVIGGGSAYPHSLLVATVEVVCLLLIIWNAWKWEGSDAAPQRAKAA